MLSAITTHVVRDQGARETQQDFADAVAVSGGRAHLLVLADGVGGGRSGDKAASIAVDAFVEAAKQGRFDDPEQRSNALQETLREANLGILHYAERFPDTRGMATTLVAAILTDHDVEWISVGDSHLYLVAQGELKKLNVDHSTSGLARQHEPGMPRNEAPAAPNELQSALGGGDIPYVDLPVQPYNVNATDICILASDGLDTLDPVEIAAIALGTTNPSARSIARDLLEIVLAKHRDRQDNVSIVVGCNERALAARHAPPATSARRTAAATTPGSASDVVVGQPVGQDIRDLPGVSIGRPPEQRAGTRPPMPSGQRTTTALPPAAPRGNGARARAEPQPVAADEANAPGISWVARVLVPAVLLLVVAAVGFVVAAWLFDRPPTNVSTSPMLTEQDLKGWRISEVSREYPNYLSVPVDKRRACLDECRKDSSCGFVSIDLSGRGEKNKPYDCRLYSNRLWWWQGSSLATSRTYFVKD